MKKGSNNLKKMDGLRIHIKKEKGYMFSLICRI